MLEGLHILVGINAGTVKMCNILTVENALLKLVYYTAECNIFDFQK